MFEVAQAMPQYSMADLDEMPTIQFSAIRSRLSLGEYRRHLPTAQLEALLRNVLGGKGGDGKPLPEWKAYHPHELLPGYAQPEALHRNLPFSVSQCSAIMDALADRELPDWVVWTINAIMPMNQVMRLGGTRQGENSRDGFEEWIGGQEYAEV